CSRHTANLDTDTLSLTTLFRSKLDAFCPQCGRTNPPGSRFCNECGASLSNKANDKNVQPPMPNPQSPAAYTPSHLAERIQAERRSEEHTSELQSRVDLV